MVPCWWPAAPDVIWHIYSHLHYSTGDGGRESPSSGDVALTRSPVSLSRLAQIQFFRGSWVKRPSSLALLKMVPHQWPVALVVIWHIYSCLSCSSEDSARDLPSSGNVVLGQGQVPCEFRADWPNFIFQPVAPDVIWHIYSHLYCSSKDGGRDLPSSGEAAPTMGKVPCEFRADQPEFSFSGGRVETRVLPALPCPGWCIINGQQLRTWFGTFTHTCTAHQGMVAGTCHLQGRQPLPWGRSPVSFRQISLGVVFQGKNWDMGPSSLALPRIVHHQWLAALDVIWHIYSHLYCPLRDGSRDLPSLGEAAPTTGQVPCEFRADWPTFIFQLVAPDVIWHIYSGQHCFKGV